MEYPCIQTRLVLCLYRSQEGFTAASRLITTDESEVVHMSNTELFFGIIAVVSLLFSFYSVFCKK